MESNSGLESSEAPRNSKRQRRPSVRLGEIGDVPLALFLENRPLKRKKKRAAAAAVTLIQVEDGLEEREEEDDPNAVDMSGFQRKAQEAKKTKALELVHDAEEESARKSGEKESERVETDERVEVAQERDREKEREKGGGDKKKKRKRVSGGGGGGGKKAKKKSSSSSFTVKNWRARKVLAGGEEDASKIKKSTESESSLGKEDEELEALAEENKDRKESEVLESEIRESELKEFRESESREDAEREEPEVELEGKELEDELEQQGGTLKVQEDGGESLGREEDREQEKEDRNDGREEERRTRTVRADGDDEERFVLPEFVRNWLQERRLGKYCDLFEFHEVDEEALPLLTVEDLREMGVHAVGSRRRMFHAILGLAARRCD